MTAPTEIPETMWLPTISVYSDGQWVADGRDPSSNDPQILTGLTVRWGRSTVVDQPQPSTCTFTLEDRAGGGEFLDMIHVGGRLDVTTDAILDEGDGGGTTVVIDEQFTAGKGNVYLATGSGAATLTTSGGVLQVDTTGTTKVTVVVPPAPRQPVDGDPTAWDDVPRSLSGQVWTASVIVQLPVPFLGYDDWAATLRLCTFASPWADAVLLDPPLATTTVSELLMGSAVPPANVWVGVVIELFPIGPTWDDLPSTPTPVGRANKATNPRAVASGSNGWLTGRGFGTDGAGTYSYLTGQVEPAAGTGITTARRKTWTTAATANGGTGFQIYDTATTYFPVTAGTTLTFSVWMRYSTTPKNLQFILQFFDRLSVSEAVMVPGTGYAQNVVAGPAANTWYRLSYTALVPAGAKGVSVYADVGPGGTNWAVGATCDATGLMIEQVATVGTYFDGSTAQPGAAWGGAPNASDSSLSTAGPVWDLLDPTLMWDQLGRFLLDSVQLTVPSTGVVRLGMVFSGRVTDLEASYDIDQGAVMVEVTAADQRAELGNRDVGDEPWLEETLGARFAKIIAVSGQPVESRVSPTAAHYLVSWRDVDRQPAMRLLDELATSADGVLWAATHPTTGPFLQLESMADRVSLFMLQEGGDGFIHIVPKPEGYTGAVEIDSCDILLEPVRWRHDIEDVATRIAVTWREQGVDDEGKQKPTDRIETVTNPPMEQRVGTRRIAVATQLSRQLDASLIADAILGRTGQDQWRVNGLQWHVNQNDYPLDADDLNVLMKLLDGTSRNGLPIVLSNLPDWTPIAGSDRVPLFLEGGIYHHEDGAWELDLIVSSANTVGDSVTWDELPNDPDWTWDDFGPEVRWIDMGGVSAPVT